jgi:putative membrane protein
MGDFGAWRRLHPAAIAVWLSSIVGQLGLFIGLALVLGGDGPPQVLSIAVASLATSGAVVRWMRLSFRIERDTLIIRGGLLSRWRRVLPFSRIQSVDVVRKLTHRLFGVVELRVEVVGGTKTEGALVALSPQDADLLRAILLSDEPAGRAHPEAPPLIRLRPVQLLLAGATGGRIAVAAALLGWMQQFLTEETLFGFFERVVVGSRSGLVVTLIVGAFVLIASVAVSLVGTIVVYWGFTARLENERLVITRGLLQVRRAFVPIHRIQAIRLEENLVRRVFGLASLRVITAGYGGGEDAQRTSMLLPIGSRAVCLDLARRVMGTPPEVLDAPLRPAPSRALTRRLVVATVVGLITIAIAELVFSAGLISAVVIVPFGSVAALLAWRALGHAIVGGHVVARSGALVRRTTIAAHRNVQHLSLTRSPTQRVFRLATVRLAIPRAATLVSDVESDLGEDRFALLADRIQR